MQETRKILLIVLDAVRYDTFIKCLRTLALGNAYTKLFTNVYAASSWTLPSVVSMLSASYPYTYSPLTLKGRPNLLSLLRRHEYRTLLINSGNVFLDLASARDFFDATVVPRHMSEDEPSLAIKLIKKLRRTAKSRGGGSPLGLIANILNLYSAFAGVYNAAINNIQPYTPFNKIAGIILKHLQERKNVFMYVHVMDSHHPWVSFPYFRDKMLDIILSTFIIYSNTIALPRRYLRLMYEIYEKSVCMLTNQLSTFIKHVLDSVPGEVTIVITADHGEGFGEHNRYDRFHEIYLFNKRLYTLFYDQLHIPLLIITNSRRMEEELESIAPDTLLSSIDILPLLLRILLGDNRVYTISRYTDSIYPKNGKGTGRVFVVAETPAYRIGYRWYGRAVTILDRYGYKLTISPFLGVKVVDIRRDREELHSIDDTDILRELYSYLNRMDAERRKRSILFRVRSAIGKRA